MKFIDKVRNWFMKDIDLKSFSVDGSLDGKYEVLVKEVALRLMAKAFSMVEFKTYTKGSFSRAENYYLFNVNANINKSASKFWQEVVIKLLKDTEALILIEGGSLYLADSFIKNTSVKGNTYTDIEIQGESWNQDNVPEDKVLYLSEDRSLLDSTIVSIGKDYKKLLDSSIKGYGTSKSRKGKLFLPTNLPMGDDEVDEMIEESLKDFYNPFKDSAYIEENGLVYTELDKSKASKSNDSGRETKNFINDIFDFIAVSYGIPPSLLKGDTVDTKDAVNNFIAFCIKPLAKSIDDEINRKMYGYKLWKEKSYVKLDVTNIKVTDLKDIANSIDLLMRNGAYTIDDTLRTLNLEPIGGDIGSMRMMTKNNTTVENMLKGGDLDEE